MVPQPSMQTGTEQSSPPQPGWQKQWPWKQSPLPVQSLRCAAHDRYPGSPHSTVALGHAKRPAQGSIA